MPPRACPAAMMSHRPTDGTLGCRQGATGVRSLLSSYSATQFLQPRHPESKPSAWVCARGTTGLSSGLREASIHSPAIRRLQFGATSMPNRSSKTFGCCSSVGDLIAHSTRPTHRTIDVLGLTKGCVADSNVLAEGGRLGTARSDELSSASSSSANCCRRAPRVGPALAPSNMGKNRPRMRVASAHATHQGSH